MENTTRKAIVRIYIDENGESRMGLFRAEGQWANGKLAYSLLAKVNYDINQPKWKWLNDEELAEEQCMYYQVRGFKSMYMERV